jgi:hypothetical protein
MSLVLVGVACVTYKQVNRHKFSDVRYDDVRSLIVEGHQRSNVRENPGGGKYHIRYVTYVSSMCGWLGFQTTSSDSNIPRYIGPLLVPTTCSQRDPCAPVC